MKKLLAVCMLVLLATPAWAAFQGGAPAQSGGFAGQPARAGTVAEALNAQWDDTWMCLEGQITSQVGGEKYLFQDATGVITVDIDHKYFGGANVTPANKVRLCGKVDKEYIKRNEFDVKSLQVLQ